MRVVLDTCILVAAWRSRLGASFELLRLLRDDAFEIAVSVPLILEYESALLRHTRAPRSARDVAALVDFLCLAAHQQDVYFLWRPLLRDPNDDMVAELAVASAASAIVTHNVSDFAPAVDLGLRVLAPAQFLLHLVPR